MQIPGVGSVSIPDYTWNRSATVNYPGGTQRTYGYDALMRLETLVATVPDSTPIMDYGYPQYDEGGNIMTKQTEHGNYTYGYDNSSRLTSADNPVLDDENYTYDNVGNRETAAGITGTWSYNQNNELLGYADVEYEYDENGNMTQITVAGEVVWTYVYDATNRLVHVEDGTGAISADYYYDPFGRRLWKDVGGVRTYFFYSDEGLIGEYDASGNELKTYGYRPDSTWTTDPLFLKEGGMYYWYQNDHLGTPQKLVATDGTVVWSALYTAFGQADVQVETVTNNLRFPGQYFDGETGLHYNYHRYYDPRIGRYLRIDPIGFEGRDSNLYSYVWNHPIYAVDPYGLFQMLTAALTAAGRDAGDFDGHGAHVAGENRRQFATGTDVINALRDWTRNQSEGFSQNECTCVKNLYVFSHAWGYQSDWGKKHGGGFYSDGVGGGPAESGFYGKKSPYDHDKAKTLDDLQADINAGHIRFCNACLITLTGCRVASTGSFTSDLARVTGCTVRAASGACDGTNAPQFSSAPGYWVEGYEETPCEGGGVPWLEFIPITTIDPQTGQPQITVTVRNIGGCLILW